MTREERKQQAIAMWQSSEWDDVARFLGPNAVRFRRVWEKTREKAIARGAGIALSWSWPALLFGFAWFLYRKQWALAVTLLIVPIIFGYFIESSTGLVGVGIVMAMYAKSFLVTDAVTKVSRIRARSGGNAEIAAAGGVSVLAGAVGGAILLIAAGAALLSILATRDS